MRAWLAPFFAAGFYLCIISILLLVAASLRYATEAKYQNAECTAIDYTLREEGTARGSGANLWCIDCIVSRYAGNSSKYSPGET